MCWAPACKRTALHTRNHMFTLWFTLLHAGYDPDLPTLKADPRLNPGKGLGVNFHPSQPVRYVNLDCFCQHSIQSDMDVLPLQVQQLDAAAHAQLLALKPVVRRLQLRCSDACTRSEFRRACLTL